jgi:hypothetical protein
LHNFLPALAFKLISEISLTWWKQHAQIASHTGHSHFSWVSSSLRWWKFHQQRSPVPPAPSGGNNAGFTNASLSGTYVFAANGITNSANLAVVGSFTADGSGNITSGTRETINSIGSQLLNESISGTYTVNQDGRGQMILNGPSASNQVIYRFVMQATSAGSNQVAKLFQISNVADATGRIELQSGTPSASGTYVVRLDGQDIGKYNYGAVGGLTLSGGNIAGTVDENDSGTFNAQLGATGSYSISATRGSANFVMPNDPTAGNNGTHNFVVYYVSPTRLELVSTNTNFWLHGYADLQTSASSSVASFTGPQVFNLSGIDSFSNYPLIQTGRFTLDGAGNVTSGIEDYNENLVLYPGVSFTGTYGVAPTGRWTSTLSTPGSFISSLSLVGWQVSPTLSVLLTQSGTSTYVTNYGVLETGEIRAQTLGLSTSNVSGNYANNLSGYANYTNVGNTESTGNYLADGNGNLSGTIDSLTDFDDGAPTVNDPQTGTYTIDPTYGRSSGYVSGVPVEIYTVDQNTLYLISSDPASVY